MSKIDVLGQDRPEANAEFEYFNEASKYHRLHAVRDSIPIADHLQGPVRLLEISKNYKKLYNCETLKLETQSGNVPAKLEDCLRNRQSCRQYASQSLTLSELAALMNLSVAATRVSHTPMFAGDAVYMRPYPSGGGLYPIDLYVIGLNVESQSPFIAQYNPIEKCLYILTRAVDMDRIKSTFMLKDGTVDVPLIIVFGGVFFRSTAKYGDRGYRLTLLEAGHIGQNICLVATALKLGSVAWSSYYDDEANQLLGLDGVAESAIHCVLVGHPNRQQPS